MSKYLLGIFLVICLFFIPAVFSQSIELVSTNVDGNAGVPATEFSLDIGSGNRNDFAVLMCGTAADGGNSFIGALPDSLATLSAGTCGAGSCIEGVFAGRTETDDEIRAFCRWTNTTELYNTGAFRYSGVDSEEPVIDFACDTGTTLPPTAPSVITEADSVVIRTFTHGGGPSIDPNNFPQEVLESQFVQFVSVDARFVVTAGVSFQFDEAGTTGEYDFPQFSPNLSPGGWRACTIALRGQTFGPKPIPTMSEWGIGIFAALTAAASIWALRRRTRTA